MLDQGFNAVLNIELSFPGFCLCYARHNIKRDKRGVVKTHP